MGFVTANQWLLAVIASGSPEQLRLLLCWEVGRRGVQDPTCLLVLGSPLFHGAQCI